MLEYKFDTQLLIEGTGLDEDRINGIPFVPQKFRNFPAILEHRKIQANPL